MDKQALLAVRREASAASTRRFVSIRHAQEEEEEWEESDGGSKASGCAADSRRELLGASTCVGTSGPRFHDRRDRIRIRRGVAGLSPTRMQGSWPWSQRLTWLAGWTTKCMGACVMNASRRELAAAVLWEVQHVLTKPKEVCRNIGNFKLRCIDIGGCYSIDTQIVDGVFEFEQLVVREIDNEGNELRHL